MIEQLRTLETLLSKPSETRCGVAHENLRRDASGMPMSHRHNPELLVLIPECEVQHGGCPHLWEKIRIIARSLYGYKVLEGIIHEIDTITESLLTLDERIRTQRTNHINDLRQKEVDIPTPEQADRNAAPFVAEWKAYVASTVEPTRIELLAKVRACIERERANEKATHDFTLEVQRQFAG